MIDFNSNSDWDIVSNNIISAIPVINDYNEWINVVGLAKEAGYTLETVQNLMPGNSEGLDKTKWDNLKTGRNDILTARKILYSIAKDNGYSLPITEKYQQTINWIAKKSSDEDERKQNIANAKKVLQSIYGDDGKFIITKGKWSVKENKYIPDNANMRQYTTKTITDEVFNSIYYGNSGCYIMLCPVDSETVKSIPKGNGIRKEMIKDYPYFFIESDPEDGKDYNKFINETKKKLETLDLPWIAMNFSGKKSIHIIIRMDAHSEDEFSLKLSKIRTYLKQHDFSFDESNKNANKWCRFFVGGREGKQQHIIAINDNPIDFDTWYHRHPELQPKKSCNGLFSGGKVDVAGFYSLMKSLNVYRVNDDGKYKAVQTKGKFIREMTLDDCLDIFSEYIDSSDDELNKLEEESLNKFRRGVNETIIRNFKGIKPLIHTDTKEAVYLYFKNGILEITKDQTRLIDYNSFDGYIWNNAYKSIEHDYNPADGQESIFSKFITDIAGNEDNIKKFKSAIGFALQRAKTRFDNRALFFIDSKASATDDESEVKSTGRTGKGLILQAIKQFRDAGAIDAKRQMTNDDRFLFSAFKKSQSLYYIQDIKPSFRMESIYNVITDEFCIEHKGKDKEIIDFKSSPKIIITANSYPKHMDNESTLGRLCILEVKNIFNSNESPADKYHCEFFSSDYWDNAEWNRFFAFIVSCIQQYLNHGLILTNSNSIQNKINESGQSMIVREFLLDRWENKTRENNTYTINELWVDFINDPKNYLRRCGMQKSKDWFSKSLRKFPFMEYSRKKDSRMYIIHDPEDPATWPIKDNKNNDKDNDVF